MCGCIIHEETDGEFIFLHTHTQTHTQTHIHESTELQQIILE